MAKEKLIQSANFKRDYVTAFAVGLFILMFISEICVAISIPLVINYTSLYADHGKRQKMVSSFDALRIRCVAKGKINSPQITTEKRLIRADLDMLSSHLREYNRTMPMDEVEEVIEKIQNYNTIVNRLNSAKAKPFCKTESLKLDKITERIENQLDSYQEPTK